MKPRRPRHRSLPRTRASLPTATKGLLPMLSRTDRVSSTECDRYPYADHDVLGIRRQERARCGALFRADFGRRFPAQDHLILRFTPTGWNLRQAQRLLRERKRITT